MIPYVLLGFIFFSACCRTANIHPGWDCQTLLFGYLLLIKNQWKFPFGGFENPSSTIYNSRSCERAKDLTSLKKAVEISFGIVTFILIVQGLDGTTSPSVEGGPGSLWGAAEALWEAETETKWG